MGTSQSSEENPLVPKPVESLVEALLSAGGADEGAAPETSGATQQPATIDGVLIPEGVDPSFLEALPEAIRREVLAEQLALRPTPTVPGGPSGSGDPSGTINVSPEFLAALPPDVQDYVNLYSIVYMRIFFRTG